MNQLGRGMAALAAVLFAAGCVASRSPVARDFPYLKPGAAVDPDRIGAGAGLPDLAPDEPWTLARVLEVAFARNPEIRQARAAWAADAAAVVPAGSLPDPMVRFTHLPEPVQTRAGPQRQRFMVVQKIPFPWTLAAKAGAARERAEGAWVRYDMQVRDTAFRIRWTYFELIYLRGALAIVEKARGLAEELAALAEGGRARDQATLFDAVKARGQIAQLLYDQVALEELLAVETTRLNALMDRPPEAPVGELAGDPVPVLETSLDALYRLALDHAQEIALADRRIGQRGREVDAAVYGNVPDVELGAEVMLTDPTPGAPGTGTDAWGLSVGLTLPVWLHRNAARIREAERRLDAEFHGKRAAIQAALVRVKAAYLRFTTAGRLVRLYEDSLLPQAEDAVRKAETWFRAEEKNLSEVLEAQAVLVNFQLAALRAAVDLQQALARLERATGGRAVPAAGGTGGRDEEK